MYFLFSLFCRTRGLSQDQPPQQMHLRLKSHINQISSGIDQSISPPAVGPPLWHGPPNQIPTIAFYIFSSIRDFTHSFRFDPPVFLIRDAFPHQSFAVTKCHKNLWSFSFSFAAFMLCFTARLAVTVCVWNSSHFYPCFIRSTFAHCWVVGSRKMPLLRLRLLNGWTGRGGN